MTIAGRHAAAAIAATPPWLNTKQASDRMQAGKKVVYRAVKSKKLRAARIGRDLRFLAEWVDEFMIATSTAVEVGRP